MNATEKQYQIVNGTYYDARTPAVVVQRLENCRVQHVRVRLDYGDAQTGLSWLEENDVEGTIGRSMGPIKIPLIIPSARSSGGPGILDHCIVRLRTAAGLQVLWKHPQFHTPVLEKRLSPLEGYQAAVYADGVNIANFRTVAACDRWLRLMR